ncbi:DUF4917 family protein [Caulobacter sp. RL271]|uniref:DUF4917 family protein n=1 Tax=Caulobacter segnis TaxID=88688 RepID=A0ABY4ZWN3_9CAUL|nr:DUF4917 family protein [Caulobacter segnis]USQ96759.1 DUF4917 family protein [Caulobacter segnis]
MTPITFTNAIERTAQRRRHLLLGNGFSISAWSDFRYDALQGKIVGESDRIDALFDSFQTADFERVARALREAQRVLEVHEGAEALIKIIENDHHDLRRLLVSAIAGTHPAAPSELGDLFDCCASFLGHFVGKARGKALLGNVFSTNYDLLLYWALMRGKDVLEANDGFLGGRPLTWAPGREQRIFYLHGALHLFEAEGVTQKLAVPDRLIDAIGGRIEKQDVPLFISEGSSHEKRVRIEESRYLKAASDCLGEACDDPEASLFIFGHSLRAEDAHIFERIPDGRVSEVFISVRDVDRSEAKAEIRKAAELWVAKRAERGGPPLEVFSYNPAEAAPWG